jgi:hypothetical protein
MRKSEAVEKWIEKWGAGLDWEAKAELRKAVEKAIEEAQNPITNYEMIKKMSIEEMAVTIMCPINTGTVDASFPCDKRNCCECTLRWLQQEAEREGTD